VVPFPLGRSSDPDGMYCMLAVLGCQGLGQQILPDAITTVPRGQRSNGSAPKDYKDTHSRCQLYPMSHQMGGRLTNVGNLMGYSESRSFTSFTNQSTLSVGRADVWWYGGGPLLETVPGNWAGTCALVQLAVPFTLPFGSPARATKPRKRRDIDIDTAANRRSSLVPHACIDAIGVPRGCQMNSKPEIKLRQDLNQYLSGGPL
jgi:hypothetical protein